MNRRKEDRPEHRRVFPTCEGINRSVTIGKEDARSKSVTLTKAGREKLTRVLPGY